MEVRRKQRQRCQRHFATDRDWSYYALSYARDGVGFYYCILCREIDNDILAGWERSQAHNQRQKDAALERYWADNEVRAANREKLQQLQQEELWDRVIRKELCRQIGLKGYQKYLFSELLPKELIQLKRANMKLQRAIVKARKEHGRLSKPKTST